MTWWMPWQWMETRVPRGPSAAHRAPRPHGGHEGLTDNAVQLGAVRGRRPRAHEGAGGRGQAPLWEHAYMSQRHAHRCLCYTRSARDAVAANRRPELHVDRGAGAMGAGQKYCSAAIAGQGRTARAVPDCAYRKERSFEKISKKRQFRSESHSQIACN